MGSLCVFAWLLFGFDFSHVLRWQVLLVTRRLITYLYHLFLNLLELLALALLDQIKGVSLSTKRFYFIQLAVIIFFFLCFQFMEQCPNWCITRKLLLKRSMLLHKEFYDLFSFTYELTLLPPYPAISGHEKFSQELSSATTTVQQGVRNQTSDQCMSIVNHTINLCIQEQWWIFLCTLYLPFPFLCSPFFAGLDIPQLHSIV